MKVNTNQVIKNIARAIYDKPEKLSQLDKVQSISIHCTSDDHITIKCEMYLNNIVRYLIEGTRSGMTVTVNTLTNEICRKPRNEKPWYFGECDCWCQDILSLAK